MVSLVPRDSGEGTLEFTCVRPFVRSSVRSFVKKIIDFCEVYMNPRHMNCSPKGYVKLVVFEHKMEPLVGGTVLGVLDVRSREYWSILLCRKKSG